MIKSYTPDNNNEMHINTNLSKDMDVVIASGEQKYGFYVTILDKLGMRQLVRYKAQLGVHAALCHEYVGKHDQ